MCRLLVSTAASVLAIALGAMIPAVAMGRAIPQALDAAGTPSEAKKAITRILFIGLAMIESLAYVLVIVLIILFRNPLLEYLLKIRERTPRVRFTDAFSGEDATCEELGE